MCWAEDRFSLSELAERLLVETSEHALLFVERLSFEAILLNPAARPLFLSRLLGVGWVIRVVRAAEQIPEVHRESQPVSKNDRLVMALKTNGHE